jgi:hypothetical protein
VTIKYSIGTKTAARRTKTRAKVSVATREIEDMVDIQAGEHNEITDMDVRKMVDFMFCRGSPTAPLNKGKVIPRLNFLSSFFASAQICRRGQDLYDQTLEQRYVKVIKTIGALPGTICSFFISRRSKDNLGDRKNVAAAAPHADPLRDCAFYYGLLWIWRFFFLKELGDGIFPDFRNYHLLASMASHRKVDNATKLRSIPQVLGLNFFRFSIY